MYPQKRIFDLFLKVSLGTSIHFFSIYPSYQKKLQKKHLKRVFHTRFFLYTQTCSNSPNYQPHNFNFINLLLLHFTTLLLLWEHLYFRTIFSHTDIQQKKAVQNNTKRTPAGATYGTLPEFNQTLYNFRGLLRCNIPLSL